MQQKKEKLVVYDAASAEIDATAGVSKDNDNIATPIFFFIFMLK
ncbi:hypothetical protein [Niallia taxi]